MAYPTGRVMLFDRNMAPLGDLSPEETHERVRSEELNGEHVLTVTTTRRLEEGWRVLTVDGTGRWREWVVTECPQTHEDGPHAVGTYQLVWSLQYDLTHCHYHDYAEVGMDPEGPRTSQAACDFVLLGQTRWTRGTCDAGSVESGQGCFSVYESAWERLTKVVEAFGCEVDATIEVSNVFGVTARRLNLLRHVGYEDVTRRFDWGHDITGITRTPDPGPYYCRVVPLGKGETEYAGDDETTFDWPLDITEEEPSGRYYIEDADAAAAFRMSDGNGGWIYPTKAVSYDEDDPELLYDAALADLHNHTRPNVTYEADVVQLARAGMDVQGVTLGDEVQCVDRGFNPDAPLRIQGRVTAIEVDELSPETGTTLTIGNLHEDMAGYVGSLIGSLSDLSSNVAVVKRTVSQYSTQQYVQDLLKRINTEIAATGGYAYLVPGEGIVTYDVEVADPLVATEATRIVQIKGGSIRIASTRRGPGIDNWDFKTVIQDGHILSELVTAAQLTSGYIGSAASGNYWDLDSGSFRIAATALTNSLTQAAGSVDVARAVFNALTQNGATQGLFMQNNRLYINASYITSGYIGNTSNSSYWNLNDGTVVIKCNTANSLGTYDRLMFKAHTFTDRTAAISGYTTEQTAIGLLIGYDIDTPQGLRGTNRILIAPNVKTKPEASYLYNEVSMITSGRALKLLAGGATNYASVGYMAVGPYYIEMNTIGSSSINDGIIVTSGDVFLAAHRSDYTTNAGYSYYVQSTIQGYGMHVHRNRVDVNTKLNVSGAATLSSTLVAEGNTTIRGTFDVTNARATFAKNVNIGDLVNTAQLYVAGTLIVQGTKNRMVGTPNYGDRLMYSYETASPMFGDVGSAVIGSDGIVVVEIDDVMTETTNTGMAYQVFLQKCGPGDLWVAEKRPTHFIVEGTPDLAFDWEVKGHQVGYEMDRAETYQYSRDINFDSDEYMPDYDRLYADDEVSFEELYMDELNYISLMEALYEEEA